MDEPFDPSAVIPVDPAAAVAALADAEQVRGRYDTAVALYRLARSLAPQDTVIASRLARALFCQEDWPAAWRAYAVRHRLSPDAPRVARRAPDGTVRDYPRWRGGPAPRRVLVLHEQGLGDTIQFCRFLPDLLTTGASVMLAVPRVLVPMMVRLGLPLEVRPMEDIGSLEGVDAWLPLLDLPQALSLGPDRYPPAAPYLVADPQRVARWRNRVGEDGLKVGVAWAGNPASPGEPGRSAPLAAFAPLAALPGVRLFSLQKGRGQDIRDVPFADRFEDVGPNFDEEEAFADTAALVSVLDAVVTVDTAVAHLAGGLGRPVHLLLKTPWADWRWLGRQSDTVWYPSMALYRQDRAGDWSAPVIRATAALAGRSPAVSPAAAAMPTVPVSVGELVDKITILEIKAGRLDDEAARANVMRELGALREAQAASALSAGPWSGKAAELRRINEMLWALEDEIRIRAAAGQFDSGYVDLARAIHETNDRRAALKREINGLAGSALVEEKSYGRGA